MPSKDGWTLDREHDKITLGKKQYRNMEEWSRPCSVCGEKFSIFVRANSTAVNSSFGLKTCKDHRGQRIEGGSVAASAEDVAAIKQELQEAYDANMDQAMLIGSLKQENEALRARLAQYELPSAMAAAEVKNSENKEEKMPWVA